MSDAGGPVEAFELRTLPPRWWLLRVTAALTVALLAAAVAAAAVVALVSRGLVGLGVVEALVAGGAAAFFAMLAGAAVGHERRQARSVVLARLDSDGAHVRLGDADWTTLPWGWVASVSLTTLDEATVRRLGTTVPLELVRFTLRDDRLPDTDVAHEKSTEHLARLLRLTPSQARWVVGGHLGRTTTAGLTEWIQRHVPSVPVLVGSALPWSTPAVDAIADVPPVAVVGAGGRLGRHVVATLAERGEALPVALVRNEVHRAPLERLGAEVRMVDLAQGTDAVADALRGCAAVVHVATGAEEVLVAAARQAGPHRVVLVPDALHHDDVVAGLAGSGLAWTVFRPAGLTDGAATGEVDLGDDVAPGAVPRADLAEVLVASIRDEASVMASWPITGTVRSALPTDPS